MLLALGEHSTHLMISELEKPREHCYSAVRACVDSEKAQV